MTSPEVVTEVESLLASYGHAIDRCDAERWAGLFHPRGISKGPGRRTLRGRAELARWVHENPRRDLLHTCTNIWIESGDAKALRVASHFVIHRADPSGRFEVAVAGTYADHLVRHEGRLVFLTRTATPRVGALVPLADREARSLTTPSDDRPDNPLKENP